MNLNAECILCKLHSETAIHLFFQCVTSQSIWIELDDFVIDVSDLLTRSQTVEGLLQQWPTHNSDSMGARLWALLPYAIIWNLWLTCNTLIFRNCALSLDQICRNIKATLWFWLGGSTLYNNFGDLLRH
ncbi:hypothetical protein FRX31_006700 [Thalictrum thalictroides]|uniref:Reverse transcriptase zinc-binding domain-containing protein n=1 Tax=Thalictrum thalictroides TaxID=46969 RepID=A0A7J6X2Z4_THATH|nr:hypothetical protein FRX31_006700 [Thalictrum thalictroides]